MTDPTPAVEPSDDDLPPVFIDPDADNAPAPTQPAEHVEPDEDE